MKVIIHRYSQRREIHFLSQYIDLKIMDYTARGDAEHLSYSSLNLLHLGLFGSILDQITHF